MAGSKFQEQFHRAERWHGRLMKLNDGRLHDSSTVYYQDDVYAFFMNCYHVKDWIINDTGLQITGKRQRVEAFINRNPYLSVCADLCNSLKHLELLKPRSGRLPEFSHAKISLRLGEGATPTIAINYAVNTGTALGVIDAFVLASNCIEAWRQFITDLRRKR